MGSSKRNRILLGAGVRHAPYGGHAARRRKTAKSAHDFPMSPRFPDFAHDFPISQRSHDRLRLHASTICHDLLRLHNKSRYVTTRHAIARSLLMYGCCTVSSDVVIDHFRFCHILTLMYSIDSRLSSMILIDRNARTAHGQSGVTLVLGPLHF